MMPIWDIFVEELEELSADTRVLEFLDGQVIQEALGKVKEGVKPEMAIDPDYKVFNA